MDNAPWVTEAVRLELWRRLEQKNLPSSGLIVNTTVDRDWQKSLQDLTTRFFGGIHQNGLEMSALILDARGGDIRAMVGGSDFYRSQFNRAMDLYRPIGATIYPMIFAWGIERGLLKVDGYSSLSEAAIKSRFAEAEQIAPEIGYGSVREKLMGLGFVVKDAMAIDEMHGSPLTLARSYLGIAGGGNAAPHGLISGVMARGESIYSTPKNISRSTANVNPSVAWVIRQWMSIGSAVDSRTLAGQPLLKAVKGWNAWWIIPRDDVVIAAWVGADSRQPKNPAALKDADGRMDSLITTWISQNLGKGTGLGHQPEGISYRMHPGGAGRPAVRVPFVVSGQGVFYPPAEIHDMRSPILEKYTKEGSAYYSSARLWDDGVIDPRHSRKILAMSLASSLHYNWDETKFGIFRM